MIKVGLRVDVDTLRGTKKGVLPLLQILGERKIQATFFFSVGPDNMGRHLWRLLRPQFALKMLRSRAASLYGWDILLRGTIGNGAHIGQKCEDIIRATATAGHEIGLHAWDHHHWQNSIEKMSGSEISTIVQRGVDEIKRILKRMPDCFAAPAWRISEEGLVALEEFPFLYRSDCRGRFPFLPFLQVAAKGNSKDSDIKKVEGCKNPYSLTPQIPTTLPTYDEMIGRCCEQKEYNKKLLEFLTEDTFHVLTIHAEAEGIACANIFTEFLDMAEKRGVSFCPLGSLVSADINRLPVCRVEDAEVAGREGVISMQGESLF